MFVNVPLSVCLGVNRFNFSTSSLTFRKFCMNFLSLDVTPTLYFFFFEFPAASSEMAGVRICEVEVTRACFTVVASLGSSHVSVLITVHRLHRKHSLYITFVVRIVPTLTHFPYFSDLAIFIHTLMVTNVLYSMCRRTNEMHKSYKYSLFRYFLLAVHDSDVLHVHHQEHCLVNCITQ